MTQHADNLNVTITQRLKARWARLRQRRAIRAAVRRYNTMHPAERLAVLIRILDQTPAARREFRRALHMEDAPNKRVELVGAMPSKLKR